VRKPVKKSVAVQPAETAHHPAGPCLNCNASIGEGQLYCPNCGQKRLEKEDMSFRHMIGESFLDYFHFDSKFFRTVIPLLFNPGILTLEFMKGKRRSYVEPFKLFLVISVIYFLLLPLGKESATKFPVKRYTYQNNKLLKVTDEAPMSLSIGGISATEGGRDSLRKAIDSIGIKAYVDKKFADDGWLVRLLMRQGLKILVYSGHSFKTILEHTASKMIFLLIPVFALLLKWVYRKGKRLYFEHLIFSLHIHSFVFLLLIVQLLLNFLLPVSMMIVIAISLVYLFFALKKNYEGSIWRSLWKLLALMLLYFIIALPGFFITLTVVSLFLV
jgi:hypothetical protein